MFWGLIMEPQRRYSQTVKKSFHVSMAALDVSNANEEPAQVMCSYEGRNYLLCTLKKPDIIQCPLDLNFEEGSYISFASNGKCHVHLTGYLTDNLELETEESEDDGDQEDVVQEEVPSKKKKKQKVADSEPPKKKSKLTNSILAELQAEEEEDDEDFTIEEEDSGSSSSDDEEVEEDGHGEEEEEEEEGGEEEEESSEDEEDKKPVEEAKVNGVKKEKTHSKKKEKEIKQKNKQKQQPESQTKSVKRVLQGGVIVEDLKEGEGPLAKNGKYINVYYEGKLKHNNKVFDSALKGPGFKFRLGSNEVIKGWDVGLVGMKQGGKRRISCPPNSAYGAKGSPPVIPPNATLVFDVELLKVK